MDLKVLWCFPDFVFAISAKTHSLWAQACVCVHVWHMYSTDSSYKYIKKYFTLLHSALFEKNIFVCFHFSSVLTVLLPNFTYYYDYKFTFGEIIQWLFLSFRIVPRSCIVSDVLLLLLIVMNM